MSERYLRPPELAARLGVDVETVRRWLLSGQLPGRKIGRSWFTAESELDERLRRRGRGVVA